ncbi:Mce4/Rvon3499c/MTV023.06c protein [Nonlabens tegetincola]|uniref:Mce4/Rvon3499c/MTV023.06c protein n=1 Tax=Nonlabens tegetincola TaxID=323273 RepID=A0A090Q593_9FLAO|nr:MULTISPECIES: MlaD family protein [Nonlabens]ALM19869.1 ABC transporter substrate-binding protein [Nonlabens sp. MIC269]GAK98170.1 Mce4/Rvon3499c/MTV023.06c protein [Nonlabens tegetincola]
MKVSKEVKVGILTVASIALFIFGYQYLKGRNLLQDDRNFYAVYDNVEGLTKSAPVTINGLRVGNIDDIQFLDSSGRLLVSFHVDGSFNFSKESTASVYSTGLIGGKALAIVPNFSSDGPIAKDGDTLSSKIDEGLQGKVMDEFLPLKDKIEHLITTSDSVMSDLHKTLNKDTRTSITNSLAEIEDVLREFKGISRNTNQILGDNKEAIDRTIKNLDKTSSNFAVMSDSLAQIELAGTIKSLETSVGKFNNLLDQVSNGEGSLGKLMTDDKLYVNLEKATRQAEELLQDIKLNPKRYVHFSVFGKKPGEYEEPENRDR